MRTIKDFLRVLAQALRGGDVSGLLGRCLFFLALAAHGPVVRELCAQVDQENWFSEEPDPGKIPGFYPGDLRQEFRPRMNALDSVELFTYYYGAYFVRDNILTLNIREGGVDGPIIATSLYANYPQPLEPKYYGPATFRFTEPVSLTPSQLYAFQLVPVEPPNPEFLFLASGNAYSDGRLFINGSVASADLFFREGIDVPEPTSFILLTISVLGLWIGRVHPLRKWRSKHKQ